VNRGSRAQVSRCWRCGRTWEWSHEETARQLSLSEAQIRAAVDYCEANPEEIAAVREARREREAAMADDLDI